MKDAQSAGRLWKMEVSLEQAITHVIKMLDAIQENQKAIAQYLTKKDTTIRITSPKVVKE